MLFKYRLNNNIVSSYSYYRYNYILQLFQINLLYVRTARGSKTIIMVNSFGAAKNMFGNKSYLILKNWISIFLHLKQYVKYHIGHFQVLQC